MPLRTSILYPVSCIKKFSKKYTKYIILNTKYRKSEGFSLVEIILSLFSISILSLILITSIQSLSTRRRQDLSAIASKAATKEIEQLRNLNFSSITATTSPLACSSEFTQAGTSSYLPGCSIRRDVDSYQGDSLIKQVGLTVSWTTTGSQTKSVTMQTLMTSGGL